MVLVRSYSPRLFGVCRRILGTEDEALRRQRCVLRIRTEPGKSLLTFKGPLQPGTMKIREEYETVIGDGDILRRVFEQLGLHVSFRYEKYREEYAAEDVTIALDETPVGTFVEIEGGEEAIVALARHMKFRPQSMQGMPADKRAKYLAQLPAMTDSIAARALVAYHLAHQRPMMGAFLDALGITHENGLITEESPSAPEAEKLDAAVKQLAGSYPKADVARYFWTLLWQDPETWGGLQGRPELALE